MAEEIWSDDPTFKKEVWTDDPTFKKPEGIGIGQTIADKFSQGISGQFGDELAGIAEGAGKVLGLNGGGEALKHFALNDINHLKNDLSKSDEGMTTDWDVIKHAYLNGRNKARAALKQESEDHPYVSGAADLAGSAASPINAIAKGMTAAKAGLTLGAINGLGNSDAEDLGGMAKDAALGSAIGGTLGKTLDVASPFISKKLNQLSGKLGSAAEGLAVNATGATGKQASEFADDAGRQLLDRNLVRFGDKPANIANRLESELNTSHEIIDNTLKELDARGVKASADNVVKELEAKIASMKNDPSQASIAKKLQNIVLDITESGNSEVPISLAEQTKRGFNKAAGNWMDPEAGAAGKAAYQGYRNEVENAAEKAAPELAQQFTAAKETYGLLAPIKEAAERRAFTTNQSPWGGLGDLATAATASTMGGPMTAVPAVVAKKLLFPRMTSSAAVTLDGISKMLLQSPTMKDLATKNPQAFEGIVTKLSETVSENANKIPGLGSWPKSADQTKPQGPSASNDSPSPQLVDRVMQDPSMLAMITNPQLKENLQKEIQKRNLKTKIPLESAQAQFIQGN